MHKSHRFDIKKIQKFSGPLPRPHPQWGGGYPLPTPHPLGAFGGFGASILAPSAPRFSRLRRLVSQPPPPLKISGYATERPNPDAAIADNDENLFRKMLYNVQKQFLPGVTNHQYHVRQRRHNDCLTGKTDDKRLCIFGLKNAYTNPFQCEWPF